MRYPPKGRSAAIGRLAAAHKRVLNGVFVVRRFLMPEPA
jgi:hypothetical protein